MVKKTIIVLIVCDLVFGFVAAQDNKQKKDHWEKIRQIFNAYFKSPSTENAERVLAVLPDRIDVKDFEDLNKTMDIFYQEHATDLYDLVGKGDRLAIRIAFKAVQFMDGLYREDMDSLIGSSIKVAPTIFLEEALPYLKKQSEWYASFNPPWKVGISWFMEGILVSIGFEESRPDVIEKEIRLRMEALATVKRQDLLELRNVCLDILKKELPIKKTKPDPNVEDSNPLTHELTEKRTEE